MNIPEANQQKGRRHSGCCARCVFYYLNIKTAIKISQLKKTPFTQKRGARYTQLVEELLPLHACMSRCTRLQSLWTL